MHGPQAMRIRSTQASLEAINTSRVDLSYVAAGRTEQAGAHQTAMQTLVQGAIALQSSLSISPHGPAAGAQGGLSLAAIGLHTEARASTGFPHIPPNTQLFTPTGQPAGNLSLDLSPSSTCSASSPTKWLQDEPADAAECGCQLSNLISPATSGHRASCCCKPPAWD